MEEKNSTGKYFNPNKKIFKKEDLEKIEQDIINGLNLVKISQKYKIDYWAIHSIFTDFILEKQRSSKHLSITFGHKNQEYYTEEELLAGIDYKSYTWENLTEEEKQFYLNYGTENNNGADSSLE
jgi:hypothetical protein